MGLTWNGITKVTVVNVFFLASEILNSLFDLCLFKLNSLLGKSWRFLWSPRKFFDTFCDLSFSSNRSQSSIILSYRYIVSPKSHLLPPIFKYSNCLHAVFLFSFFVVIINGCSNVYIVPFFHSYIYCHLIIFIAWK